MAKKKKGGYRSTEKNEPPHIGSVPGRDPHAHPSHHAANMEHGMPEGLAPQGGYDGESCGPGMGNECNEGY